jgi:integrase/recombinase XerD
MLLSEAIEAYIHRKQSMGRKYHNCAKELRAFVRLHPTLQLSDLRTNHLANFLNCRPLRRETWISRYRGLRTFLSYWISRRQLVSLPMPPPRRPGRRVFTPYIFTPLQMRNMLAKAPEIQSRKLSEVTPEMFRTLIVFIYATGCWISEALALNWSDIDFENATIAINARVGAGRDITTGTDLKRMLLRHRRLSDTEFVFATVSGRRISYGRAKMHFRRVRKLVGIRRMDNFRCEPGFKDLRHTFAVERIVEWYRKGADIELMLPRLAHYMGLFTCTITERYLPLAPEHFREQLEQLSKQTSRPTHPSSAVRL